MELTLIQVVILALIQGAAELLPVSSSAHVIVAEKLMGLDPSSPQMTFLLVMLHTGTMFAVLAYFWKRWSRLLAGNATAFLRMVIVATACTGAIGLGLQSAIKHALHSDVEDLFKSLPLIASALFAVGLLIIAASSKDGASTEDRAPPTNGGAAAPLGTIDTPRSVLIGVVQGLCLPFRGFSRSGATISVGLFQGVSRALAEDFSFALAVALTPPVIVLELHRLLKSVHATGQSLSMSAHFGPGLLGMIFSFIAGLGALKWLSSWLENGRWKYFGIYCLVASAVVFALFILGF